MWKHIVWTTLVAHASIRAWVIKDGNIAPN